MRSGVAVGNVLGRRDRPAPQLVAMQPCLSPGLIMRSWRVRSSLLLWWMVAKVKGYLGMEHSQFHGKNEISRLLNCSAVQEWRRIDNSLTTLGCQGAWACIQEASTALECVWSLGNDSYYDQLIATHAPPPSFIHAATNSCTSMHKCSAISLVLHMWRLYCRLYDELYMHCMYICVCLLDSFILYFMSA